MIILFLSFVFFCFESYFNHDINYVIFIIGELCHIISGGLCILNFHIELIYKTMHSFDFIIVV